MAVGAVVARILTQYSDKGSKAAQKDIAKLGKNIDAFARKSARAFGIAAAASAALTIKLGKDAVKGAIEDQKQQIALATALRNTVGATDEAIAATVRYLDKLELLVGVDNNQLIPSLQILTQATKDVTVAQQLQNLALDISAGTSKDLASVSLALAKAIGGNVGALTRLGVPLDANAVKAKDLNAIIESLAATFKGQAEKRAETLEFRLMKLQLAFNQILDKLGYALIPVLEKFASVVTTKILPAVNEFVETNEKKLAASFAVATEFAVSLLGAAVNFGNWISKNMGLVKGMAILIAGMFAVSGIAKFILAIQAVAAAMAILRTTALGAAIATALATGGVSVGTAVTALAAVGATALVTKNLFDMIGGKGSPTGTKTNTKTALDNREQRGLNIPSIDPSGDALSSFLKALNKNTDATKKNTKTTLDIATENAIKFNQARQKALSGSSDLAIGGLGSRTYIPGVSVGGSSIGSTAMAGSTAAQSSAQARIDQLELLRARIQKKISAVAPSINALNSINNKGKSGGNNVNINVQGSVISNEDLLTNVRNGLQRTTKRQFGLPLREYAFGR
jgi:hypothetical protein